MGEVLFNTNEVASMLRVDKSTIKRWTDEGKLKCFRTPGGHRKFRVDDVYNFMTQFNYGVSTLQVLPQLASDEVIIKRIIQKKEYNVLTSVCFSDALKGKKDDVITLFIETYRAGLAVPYIFDFILRPTLNKIQSTFNSNKISFTEYQLACNTLSSAVAQLTDNVTRAPRNGKVIICASLELERNDVELKALLTLLEIAGYTPLNLGVGLSAEAINQMIAKLKPYAVCIHTTSTENTNTVIEEVEKVLHSAKENLANLILGGHAFNNQSIKENFVGINICSSFVDFSFIQLSTITTNVKNY